METKPIILIILKLMFAPIFLWAIWDNIFHAESFRAWLLFVVVFGLGIGRFVFIIFVILDKWQNWLERRYNFKQKKKHDKEQQ